MTASHMPCREVAGLVLAGGLARRLGRQHKAFVELHEKPLISWAVERVRPQVGILAISANDDLEKLQAFADAVLTDMVPGYAGPLAGILTGMEWLQNHHPEYRWLLSVAVDTPFFPADLCMRLHAAACREDAHLAAACSLGRMHSVFALWPVGIAADLRCYLEKEGLRRVDRFQARYRTAVVPFDDATDHDPFFNINTPEDLARAQQMAVSMSVAK